MCGWPRPSLFSLAVLLGLAAAEGSGAAGVVILSGEADRSAAAALERAIRGPASLTRRELAAESLSDPIRKGRLLSEILAADLVVPVGDDATDFVAHEAEESRTFFVGAARPAGDVLRRPHVGGILGYSGEDVLSVLDRWRPGSSFALAYTPGYDGLARAIRREAERKGMRVVEVPVARRAALPPALRALPEGTSALWILGDPLLTEDVAFEYLLEFTLSRQLALVGPSAREVERGALFAMASDPERLARAGAAAVRRILAARSLPEPRVAFGPAGGTVLVHPVLRRRFELDVRGLPSRAVP